MDVTSYLKRIGYLGSVSPTKETLCAIHRAHMLSVPFENLDIARSRRLVVDPQSNVRKIVELRRGGFCYELNGAFASLLEALGFKVTLLSARVGRAAGGFGPEFDHLTLQVDLEEPWLVDVGFGDSFVEPLRLRPGIEQERDGILFRIIEEPPDLILQKQESSGSWHNEYAFSLQPRRIEDFAGMCEYHQSSPKSHFTQNSVCSRATPDGRITLTQDKLITTVNGLREEYVVEHEEERSKILREQFGIVLE